MPIPRRGWSLLKALAPSSRDLDSAPRVLLAWEIGTGFTHTQNALGVVTHLRANGFSCVFATADPRFDPWFRAHGVQILQTYLWPPMRVGAAVPEFREARTLTDILADYAIGNPANLAAAIAHYDTLFDLVRPDIVLCENAFGALLAARGRIPTIAFGSTLLFMPPTLGDGFAPINPSAPNPSWPTQVIVDGINTALGVSARPFLSCAADIMDCAAVLPFGPAAFDPYLHARTQPVLAPYCSDLPLPIDTRERCEIVVYLHERMQFMDDLIDAIVRLPSPVRLYIPALEPIRRMKLEEAGVLIESHMMPLETIAAKAGCLVHHGGVTLTAVALALGIPQVILARFYENGLAGHFVAERSLGAWMRIDAVDARRLAEAVRECGADVAANAERAAPEFQRWFHSDPTFIVAQEAARLLGVQNLRPAPAAKRSLIAPI
jgi:rhamnosyltransferase subunit B